MTRHHRYIAAGFLLICTVLFARVTLAQTGPDHGAHGGHDHGSHGMVVPESKNFPTLGYDDKRVQRKPQRKSPPAQRGDPQKGKQLAYRTDKGRCLSCHVLGADGEQPGTVGPNLSNYAARKLTPQQTFQQIWDRRVTNPHSVMPAFGTFKLLTATEVAHIAAYLHTLDEPVSSPAPLADISRGAWIIGEDLTRYDDYLQQGGQLFIQPGDNSKACATCHTAGGNAPDLKGAATTYPQWNEQQERIVLLEQRINQCRHRYMDSSHYPLGSSESNVLSSYIKSLSRHLPIKISTAGPAAAAIARGQASFNRRTGQLNLACASCHAAEQPIAGKWLRGDVAQSMSTVGSQQRMAAEWPKHFIGGHDLGLQSLQQRIEHCQAVTRSMPLRLGSPEYVELELYLTALANGAPLLAPTVSRLRGE